MPQLHQLICKHSHPLTADTLEAALLPLAVKVVLSKFCLGKIRSRSGPIASLFSAFGMASTLLKTFQGAYFSLSVAYYRDVRERSSKSLREQS